MSAKTIQHIVHLTEGGALNGLNDVLADGWKVVHICQFNPGVIVVVEGPETEDALVKLGARSAK